MKKPKRAPKPKPDRSDKFGDTDLSFMTVSPAIKGKPPARPPRPPR